MMGRVLTAAAGAALLSAVVSGPALAQTAPPRCALLGQVSVSSWLAMAAALSKGDSAAVDASVAQLANLTASYAAIGCDQAALGQAMDCVLASSGEAAPREVGRRCVAASGFTAAE